LDAAEIRVLSPGRMPEPVAAELARRFPERGWLANPQGAAANIRARSGAIARIRNHLDGDGYLEIQTPILGRTYGGGEAEPFVTRRDGRDLYLRIAPELALKRAVVGGFDRVYEIGRNFRNEGGDRTHHPEFTTLEAYRAYSDTLDEGLQMLRGVLDAAFGHPVEFSVRRLDDLVREVRGAVPESDAELLEIFESEIEPNLTDPIAVTHLPLSASPLAEADPEDPRFALRFEFYARGMEIANAYVELRDPGEHFRRMGDRIDPDYLGALRWGLPPTVGLGVGIDRLAMWVAGADDIRQVVPFPRV